MNYDVALGLPSWGCHRQGPYSFPVSSRSPPQGKPEVFAEGRLSEKSPVERHMSVPCLFSTHFAILQILSRPSLATFDEEERLFAIKQWVRTLIAWVALHCIRAHVCVHYGNSGLKTDATDAWRIVKSEAIFYRKKTQRRPVHRICQHLGCYRGNGGRWWWWWCCCAKQPCRNIGVGLGPSFNCDYRASRSDRGIKWKLMSPPSALKSL